MSVNDLDICGSSLLVLSPGCYYFDRRVAGFLLNPGDLKLAGDGCILSVGNLPALCNFK